jgi:hypothetical protein
MSLQNQGAGMKGLTMNHVRRKSMGWLRSSSRAAVVLTLATIGWAAFAEAQVNSNSATVNLTATLPESLTISASPSSVNFTLASSGTAAGSAQVSITTAWALLGTRSSLTLYAFCASSTAALTDGSGNNIPAANLTGSPNGGAFSSFTSNSPFGTGTSLAIFTQGITSGNLNSTRTDTLNLNINTTGLSLPVGTYTGVLTIRAQAI